MSPINIELSFISEESEVEKFNRQWEKVIKSGMENDPSYLNSYA